MPVLLLTGTSTVKCVCSVTDRDNCSQGCAYLLTGMNTVECICSLTDRHDCRQIRAYLVTGTTEVGRVSLFGTIEGRWIPLLPVKHDFNQVYRFTYSRMMSAASVRYQSPCNSGFTLTDIFQIVSIQFTVVIVITYVSC